MKKQNKKQDRLYKPLSEATPEEVKSAFEMGGYWLTSELDGYTESGAFSEAFLGEPAVEYFTKRAYQTLMAKDCEWKWKEGTKFSTLFINVMRSDMAHTLRRYMEQDKPDVKAASQFERDDISDDGYDDANDILDVDPDDRQCGFQVKSPMEMLEELEREERMRDMGIKIARAAALQSGDTLLVRYVELAFTLPNYRAISKRMKITLTEVKEIEARLIAALS